jgi:hypothetical protein
MAKTILFSIVQIMFVPHVNHDLQSDADAFLHKNSVQGGQMRSGGEKWVARPGVKQGSVLSYK